MSRTIADAAERQAALDPRGSFIVQAPAGSGKTELLIQRFLALLATVERPEGILAITFTRKAAAEMRSRLLEALAAARRPRPEKAHAAQTWELARAALEQDRRFGWDLSENPGRLTIQTIDSFNASLVRRMPWLSRLGGMPQVSEDPTPLYRRAAERSLERLGSGEAGEAIACLLAHLDNRLDHLRDLLAGMLARRDQWGRYLLGRRGEEQRAGLEKALRALVEAELEAACAVVPEALRIDLAELAPFAAANLVADGKDGHLPRLLGLERFPGAAAEDLPIWLGLAELLLTGEGTLRKAVNKNCGFPADKVEPCLSMKRRMTEVLGWLASQEEAVAALGRVRTLPPVAYEEEQWRVLRALADLLPRTVAELWLVFAEEGTADFAEIALKAQQALTDEEGPSDLLLRLDCRLSHILVDEFQDTSHLQFALLRILTGGWQPDDGRTLFLVGDPMQSIYRFREAEVGLFLQARRRGLGDCPLRPLQLSANFRSQAGIVDWVNRAFALLFPSAEDPIRGAVPLAVAEAVHPPLMAPAVSVHPFAGRDDEAEARQVVALVRQALAQPEEKVAILVRSRTHLGRILPALRAAGLAYQAQEIDLLAERPVALDIASLTRALLHPADRLSWLAMLRAPWCGLTLADLHALAGGRKELIPELLADPAALARLSADGRHRAERTGRILAGAAERRGRVGLRFLVEGCWLALGGPVLLDAAALDDAARVFELLENLDQGGDLADLDLLQRGLARLYAAPDASADGRLQVMTIHKAKGLEFDSVILPGLGRRPGSGDPPLLRWLDHPEFGLLLGPIHPRDGVSRDPIYQALGRIEREKEELETTRLLYVAATRAKGCLHLLGHAVSNGKGEWRPEHGSLLKTLWPAVVDDFARLEPQDAPVAAVSTSPARLRRLPADWTPPPLTTAPLPEMVETLSPSGLGKEDVREIVFSGWEAETARHIGTVVHAFLERIAREGVDLWPPVRLGEFELPAGRRLGQLGVPADEAARAMTRVLRGLHHAVTGERGRWLLGPRAEAACEYPLCGVIDGRIVHAVIDRTFVDGDGCRWIVDYKTSEPRGEQEREAFLAAEAERYRPQLAAYAQLFTRLEPHRPVRAGLYFPLVDGWVEITTFDLKKPQTG